MFQLTYHWKKEWASAFFKLIDSIIEKLDTKVLFSIDKAYKFQEFERVSNRIY